MESMASLRLLTEIVPPLFLVGRSIRAAWHVRADVELRPFLRRTGHALVASSATAALVVGFPLLLRLTTSDAAYSTAAPLILAVSLTRAPLLIPLGSYQGVAITHFVDHPDRVIGLLARIGAVVAVITAVGSGLASLIGPWLMTAFFGDSYGVSPVLLAVSPAPRVYLPS